MYLYRLIMKSRSEPDIIVSAHIIDRDKLYEKFGQEDNWVTLKDQKFNCLDVKRAIKFWENESPQESEERKDTLTYEKRQDNIQRLEAYTKASQGKPAPEDFTPQQLAWYKEMRLCITEGIYPESDWRHAAGINRKDWQKARKVFWSTRFDSQDHELATHKAYYYQYVKGNADPRGFNRKEFVEACRNKDYAQAAEVFNT